MYLLFLGPGLFRTILFIAAIYYGIKLFSKYVLPLLVDKGLKNMQQKMQNQQRQNQPPSRSDGEVTIEDNKNDNKNKSQTQGDYVDFEEIE